MKTKQVNSFLDLFEDLRSTELEFDGDSYTDYEVELSNKLVTVNTYLDYTVKHYFEEETDYKSKTWDIHEIHEPSLIVEDYEIDLHEGHNELLELIINKEYKW